MIIMESGASQVLLKHTEQMIWRKVGSAVRQSERTTARVAESYRFGDVKLWTVGPRHVIAWAAEGTCGRLLITP